MLQRHAQVGIECDIPKENTFVLQNGDILTMIDEKIEKTDHIPAPDVYVDGNRIGEIGGAVLRDRKIMASDGILVVIANIDMKKRTLLIKPNITTRGFILINENEDLIHKIENIASTIIKEKLKEPNVTFQEIKNQITQDLIPEIYELTGRRPIILPIILDIKKTVNVK